MGGGPIDAVERISKCTRFAVEVGHRGHGQHLAERSRPVVLKVFSRVPSPRDNRYSSGDSCTDRARDGVIGRIGTTSARDCPILQWTAKAHVGYGDVIVRI